MVERENDHLDALALDDAQPRELVLLGALRGRRGGPLRRGAEPLDELVDAAGRERRARRPGDQLSPRQHVRS